VSVVVSGAEQSEGAAALYESFDDFYEREARRAVGLAFVLSGSRSAAEDLAHDAFVSALKKWNKVSHYDNPGAWLSKVVANAAVSATRRRKAEVKALILLRGDRAVSVEEIPIDNSLWEAVRKLPKRQAQTVALRYWDGRSISEVAHILGCSENTVKTHLRRAKHTLAETLDDRSDHGHH